MLRWIVPFVVSLATVGVQAEPPEARFARMTPEEVRAFENDVKAKVKTMDRVKGLELMADLALIPPEMNTSPLPEYGYDRLDYGMTIGMERTRIPVASKTAFATAGAIAMIGVSPPPAESMSVLFIRWISSLGRSLNRGTW